MYQIKLFSKKTCEKFKRKKDVNSNFTPCTKKLLNLKVCSNLVSFKKKNCDNKLVKHFVHVLGGTFHGLCLLIVCF